MYNHAREDVMAVTRTTLDSPIGPLTLVAEDGALTGLRMTPASSPDARPGAGLGQAAAQLGEYFAGTRKDFTVPVRPRGSPFDRRVWQALARIPYGHTRSYMELAREVAGPGEEVGWELARAVGAANARNPLAIIVPCHRVIGADGRLVGYGGGLERKRFLLDLERRHAGAPELAGRLF
jgi:methylated-DNA-[protein]-cysteine S-methyltransferase